MNRRVWVDVTVISDWRGTFTGIQRVVYSCVTNFNSNPSIDLHLFTYKNNNFHEVSYDTFIETLSQNSKYSEQSSPNRTLISKIRARALPTVKDGLRDVKYIGTISRITYGFFRSSYRLISNPRIPNLTDYRSANKSLFNKSDTVLLLDGNWSDGGAFARSIADERGRVGFQLAHLVNDIIAIKNPAYAARGATKVLARYFNKILPKVDTLISISKSTENDISYYCNERGISLTKDRHVVRLGDKPEEFHSRQPKISQISPEIRALSKKKFILTVGTIEVRKNHHLLYYIYKLAHEREIVLPHLVVAGRKGWLSDETCELFKRDSDISNCITVINPNDEELGWLYENCEFTVFPSFYEGWGIPIAESLSYGKVCVSSNTSSMPEVGGKGAVYLSPYDTAGWLKTLSELCEPSNLEKMTDAIGREFKPVSWKNTYEEIASILTVPQ